MTDLAWEKTEVSHLHLNDDDNEQINVTNLIKEETNTLCAIKV